MTPDIPRPPGARQGGPAPWAALSAELRRRVGADRVTAALGRAGQAGWPPPLDEWSAEPASVVLDTADLRAGARPAAVLVALFEEDGEARVLLTRRSSELRSHTGQVSFPGGRMETGEEPWACARREAWEEIGLDPSSVEPAGWLHSVLTLGSGSLILPVVGLLPERPSLRPNPAEVARLFDVALADLLADGVFAEERWPSPAALLQREGLEAGDVPADHAVFFYEVAGEMVWGATARLLTELLRVVTGAGNRPSGAPDGAEPWERGGIVEDRQRVGSAMTGGPGGVGGPAGRISGDATGPAVWGTAGKPGDLEAHDG